MAPVNTRYHGVESDQVSCCNQPVGVEFNVKKSDVFSFFIRLVLEPKSNQTQSVTKIFQNVLTTDKRLFSARDILGQRPWPLLFLAHRDIVYEAGCDVAGCVDC